MALIDELLPPSFRGVGFLVKEATTSAGRKTVTHEYPNSSRRFVEDLGKLQKVFTIEGTITGPNYRQKRDALIAALEQEGAGILVHPFLGTQNVVSTTYTLGESDSRLEDANFSMTFQRADINIFPTEGSNNISKIDSLKNTVLDQVKNDIATRFKVNRLSPVNYDDAQILLNAVATAFSVNLDEVTNDITKISEFSAVVEDFVDSINTNIFDPDELAEDFINLFIEGNETAETARDQLNLFRRFFDFGDDDTEIMSTTVARVQRINNRNVINESVQISALAEGYAASSLITYETEDDLKEVRVLLDQQFAKVVQQDIDNTTRDELTTLRNEARIFYEQVLVDVPRILEIKTQTTPITVLVHRFYGDVDNVDQITMLNDFDNPTFVEGDVKILTGPNV